MRQCFSTASKKYVSLVGRSKIFIVDVLFLFFTWEVLQKSDISCSKYIALDPKYLSKFITQELEDWNSQWDLVPKTGCAWYGWCHLEGILFYGNVKYEDCFPLFPFPKMQPKWKKEIFLERGFLGFSHFVLMDSLPFFFILQCRCLAPKTDMTRASNTGSSCESL